MLSPQGSHLADGGGRDFGINGGGVRILSSTKELCALDKLCDPIPHLSPSQEDDNIFTPKGILRNK